MKKKNQKSRSNKYWLLGTSLVLRFTDDFFLCLQRR